MHAAAADRLQSDRSTRRLYFVNTFVKFYTSQWGAIVAAQGGNSTDFKNPGPILGPLL